jgi:hypothetical protein
MIKDNEPMPHFLLNLDSCRIYGNMHRGLFAKAPLLQSSSSKNII